MTRSTVRMDADGVAPLRRDLDDFRRTVDHLEAAHDATGERVLPRIRDRSPRVSGALGASMQADVTGSGVGFTSALPYFGAIHNGWPAHNIEPQPFVEDAVLAAESEIVDVYAEHIDDALDRQFRRTY